jgi:excisionase family DNA binding protein
VKAAGCNGIKAKIPLTHITKGDGMDEQERSTYDVPEAARILGIGRSAAYEAVRRGEIPSIRLGKRLVVPRAALERMLEGREAVGAP